MLYTVHVHSMYDICDFVFFCFFIELEKVDNFVLSELKLYDA